MPKYQKVRSTLEISRRLTFCLDALEPQYFNGLGHTETVRQVNDILQGRAERTAEALLGELRQKGPGLARNIDQISRDIQAFEAQKELLAFPYEKSSSKEYAYKTFESGSDDPLKIIDQSIYDRAVKDGFPPGFFRKSYFNGVTFYCLPDNTDLNFSEFHNCTFSVCRIREATFDGTHIYDSIFHSCDMHGVTFFYATLVHTQFRDSALALVSFQRAKLAHCNTIDCGMDRVNFLNATLDGCSYDRITARNTRHLHTAAITQGGATEKECRQNQAAIFKALQGRDGQEQPRKRTERATPDRSGR